MLGEVFCLWLIFSALCFHVRGCCLDFSEVWSIRIGVLYVFMALCATVCPFCYLCFILEVCVRSVSFAALPSAACHKTLPSPPSSSKSSCRYCSGWTTLQWKMVLCVLSWRVLLCSTPQGTGSVTVLALCSLWGSEWTKWVQKGTETKPVCSRHLLASE